MLNSIHITQKTLFYCLPLPSSPLPKKEKYFSAVLLVEVSSVVKRKKSNKNLTRQTAKEKKDFENCCLLLTLTWLKLFCKFLTITNLTTGIAAFVGNRGFETLSNPEVLNFIELSAH